MNTFNVEVKNDFEKALKIFSRLVIESEILKLYITKSRYIKPSDYKRKKYRDAKRLKKY